MKIKSVGYNLYPKRYNYNYHRNNTFLTDSLNNDVTTFKAAKINPNKLKAGKHDCAKFFGGVFGTAGALGATVAFFMTGGTAAIPLLLGYTAFSAISGAVIGHEIDKSSEKFDKEQLEKKQKKENSIKEE